MTNKNGGIIDDLIVSRCDDFLYLVINASNREKDLIHLKQNAIGLDVHIQLLEDQQLIALQGPKAEEVLSRFMPYEYRLQLQTLPFMNGFDVNISNFIIPARITRCGYTGEDGFEISLEQKTAHIFADLLMDEKEVHPAGLGSRDTLRLEAGLCLYGHEIDDLMFPHEAGLAWTIDKQKG